MNTGIAGAHLPTMKSDEYITPFPIIAGLTKIERFDLDPCAPINRPWDTALIHFTKEDDGLSLPWGGRVWLNPPYGKETGIWLEKMAAHNNGTALIFARTDTDMFFKYVWSKATALLFIKGRITFLDVSGVPHKANSGGPSVLIAYGYYDAYLLKNCNISGKYIEL